MIDPRVQSVSFDDPDSVLIAGLKELLPIVYTDNPINISVQTETQQTETLPYIQVVVRQQGARYSNKVLKIVNYGINIYVKGYDNTNYKIANQISLILETILPMLPQRTGAAKNLRNISFDEGFQPIENDSLEEQRYATIEAVFKGSTFIL